MEDLHSPLAREICDLAVRLNAATCRLLELIARFDQRRAWADEGCRSCAHWLNWRCGVGMSAAREKVRVAHRLLVLPKIHGAFANGRISYSKVRAMTRVATERNEAFLLMIAEHGTAAHVEAVVRAGRRAVPAAEVGEQQFIERYLTWDYDEDGMLVVRARLCPEDGARFIQAVESMRDAQGKELTHSEPDAHTSFSAQRADALLHCLCSDLQSEVHVHVSAETLCHDAADGECALQDGPMIPAETARRLCCDAPVIGILDKANGEPIRISRRTRRISPALRRVLKARDGGCRFPGCNAHRHLQAHHIVHWARGGETSPNNLVQLCSFHHRLVHEGGFTVQRMPDGELAFKRIGRRRLLPSSPQIEHPYHEALFEIFDLDTCDEMSTWDGTHMDLGLAVDGYLAASAVRC